MDGDNVFAAIATRPYSKASSFQSFFASGFISLSLSLSFSLACFRTVELIQEISDDPKAARFERRSSFFPLFCRSIKRSTDPPRKREEKVPKTILSLRGV